MKLSNDKKRQLDATRRVEMKGSHSYNCGSWSATGSLYSLKPEQGLVNITRVAWSVWSIYQGAEAG